ncbi:MAG: hypothetical protein EOM67_12330 [Spirochaetia bacterium]|nr:hypothetical protein [Spirochaetia bacterium]
MPTLTLTFKYRKNEDLILSPSEIQETYLYGVTIQDKSGKDLSSEVYRFYIQSAQQELEKYLGIKFKMQVISESLDFYGDDFRSFLYTPTTYPVVKPVSLTGFLGQVKQLQYPSQWLVSRKTSDGETYYRKLFVVPTQSATVQTQGVSMLYSGVLPNVGMMNWKYIPNYWTAEYVTGFEKVPRDIMDVVGKIATIGILNVAGDIVLGTAALANYSLSIDGLSQSIGTTMSATNAAYGARILQYSKEIKDSLEKLKSYYRGMEMISM